MNETKVPSRTSILEAFSWLLFGIICWVCVVVYIELAPKSGDSRNTLRLVYLIAYFTGLTGLCKHVHSALPSLLDSVYRWRYEDAPLGITKAWKNQTEEISFVLLVFCFHCIVLSAATATYLLGYWFHYPSFLSLIVTIAWLTAMGMMIVFLLRVPKNFNRIFEQYRFLRRQLATCDFFEPRFISELWNPLPIGSVRRFLSAPHDGFVAGNRPWRFPLLTKNMIVFGSIGTGKTVCVMNAILDNLIASRRQPKPLGGLILDYKGEFMEKTRRLCRQHGRENDLIILSAGSHFSWNPIGGTESASEIAARFVATMKALGQKDSQTSFFAEQSETFLEHAVTLLRLTSDSSDQINITRVHRIANDHDYLDSLVACLPQQTANDSPSSALSRCRQYFQSEFFQLPQETRQSVVATLNNMLNPLCNELVAPLLSGAHPLSLADATMGSKIVYLDLPQSKVPKAGRILGLLLKLAYYAEVQRKPLDSRQYSFFFADEFQEFFTGDAEMGDTRFYCVSRQYDHINVVATQNINNFRMRGDKTETVMSFLSNIKTKIFLQNSDKDTNDYASQLFGEYVAELGGGHMGGHAQLLHNVRPEDFVSLQKPDSGVCDFTECYLLDESTSKVDVANRMFRWPVHVV